jgi:hypothetical protein
MSGFCKKPEGNGGSRSSFSGRVERTPVILSLTDPVDGVIVPVAGSGAGPAVFLTEREAPISIAFTGNVAIFL